MEFDEQALKRLIRVMNSVINLYDVEGIPKEILDYLYYPVGHLADILNIPVEKRKTGEVDADGKLALDEDENPIEEILKFLMPKDFSKWVETSGKEN